MDLYEVNNNNIESNNSYFWDPQLQFPYPKQDNVDMSQFGQLKEKNPTRSMQTNLSDHWKIELNYNEDDQELLEEMLNSQNDQNLLEEMLNSHDDMEVVKFQLPSSSHRPDSQTESHSPVALKSSRGSILKTLIHDEKIDYSKITANKKRKMPNISPKEKHRQVFNAIDQKPPWVYKITDDDSELKRSIDIKIRRFLEEADCEENTPNFRGGVSSSSRAYDPVPNAVSKGIQRRAFEYTNRISWEGCETFKKELDNLLRDWKHSKELNCQEGAFSRIEYISTVGANIMKIISKLYAEHPRSKEFGENKKILTYTNDIWKICFPKRENKAEDLAKFCKSLGAESERAREKCLSIKFNNQYSGLNQIFLAMRSRITLITEKIRILQYAWYFALLRASVFFPEEILIHNTSEVKRNTRNFISNGILYFAQIAGEKPKRRERLCTS
ncbi:hypothetical protein PPACK8108_LOCUS14782 [Phakopsora pachyrhizi]|uniref:Uncharacterized protein n=1 Tax=Phakopsora pachyrhizi TaxID=170000 RepID=A0AAV0B6Z3_PHAPC|nr:hypothetical protein PPACK8108_LOCUS14782 [Phakopsora pachyrhizi]